MFHGKQVGLEPDHLGPSFSTCSLAEPLGLTYNTELTISAWRIVLKVEDNPIGKETRSGRQAH